MIHWKRIRCLLGTHERDRHAARYDGEMFRSRCRYCGVEMKRDFALGWIKTEEISLH